ncbi:MAG: hypothetical protein PHY23_10835 [Oscillospiraceae bacterium]|nr:hypothetical protein [Oscillospiraceae bacterium]MDD4511385.1 hypothetical protein [Oscillospiraceae bacterium]
MRYDTPVFFVSDSDRRYDPDSGAWSGDVPGEVKRWANVSHVSAERQQVVFGDVRGDRFVVRLQRPYTAGFSSVRIGSDLFYPERVRLPVDAMCITVVSNG